MIVDDEPIVLEDLSDLLDWEEYGFHIVGTARNGKNALEKMEVLCPELIISDIKMPVIDGVQLAAELKKRKSDSTVILISSWAEFEYARSAIKYGVQDYVLKNDITKENFTTILEACKRKILQRRTENKIQLSLYIEKLFSGEHPLNISLTGSENRCCETESFYELLISSDIPVGLIHNRALDPPKLGIYMEFIDRMADKNVSVKTIEEIDAGVLLILMENKKPGKEMQREISRLAEQVKTFLNKKTKQSFSSFYFPEAGTLRKTANIYIRNKSILRCPLFDGSGGHYNMEDRSLCTYSGTTFVDVAQILHYLHCGKEQQLYSSLTELTERLKTMRNTEAVFICSGQLYAGITEYTRTNPSLKKETDSQSAFYSISEVFDFFRSVMSVCISVSDKNDDIKYSQATRKAIEYISNNYTSKSLGIKSIAESVGLSTNRLMFLFKQDTEHTLASYLTWYRIERAKELLQIKAFKIYEIADKTGFSSSQYFSQVFYHVTGKTPIDWREQK